MSVTIPEVKDMLKTGLQFGHNVSRWNPRMSNYLFGSKNDVHIIDVVQTRELLQQAVNFAQEIAKSGEVMFVGTKKQSSGIMREQAIRAGGHFVIQRWPGGLFTNFGEIKKSINKLNKLENQFEEGIEGRTKYEVMQMKAEWERMSRLYEGVKKMDDLPKAVIIADPRYERVAVREAKLMGIPVIALADSNCDPADADYLIPGNDDALNAIELVISTLADAVLEGNQGKGVKHHLKDYTQVKVDILKAQDQEDVEREAVEDAAEASEPKVKIKASQQEKISGSQKQKQQKNEKGILEKKKAQGGTIKGKVKQ